MKLEFVFASCHKPGRVVAFHSHKALEIVYYAAGSGSIRFGDGPAWPFQPGSFHIAPDGCLHTQTNSDELRALCVGVSGSGLEDLSGLWQDPDGILRYPCERLLAELQAKETSFELVAEGMLLQIAGLIRRLAKAPRRQAARDHKGEIVEKALHIIRESGGGANLDELSELLFVSKDYLRHLLTQATGRSPVKHLIAVRMERAARLLRETPSASVAQIAKDCGFSDVYYFSRLFKRQFSVPPAKFRDAAQRKNHPQSKESQG
jgi:AraC-like DNA-binding protein